MSGLGADLTGISTIYQFSPAFKNLYTVELFSVGSNGNMRADSSEDDSNYFKYHSTSVSFNGESLLMKRNEVTKKFQLEESNPFKRTDDLVISLRESDEWKVKRYHEDWLSQFYNKEGDYFISAKNTEDRLARYRIIRVTLPSSSGDKKIKFLVLPSNTGGFDLGWSATSEIVSHSITYKVETWEWEK